MDSHIRVEASNECFQPPKIQPPHNNPKPKTNIESLESNLKSLIDFSSQSITQGLNKEAIDAGILLHNVTRDGMTSMGDTLSSGLIESGNLIHDTTKNTMTAIGGAIESTTTDISSGSGSAFSAIEKSAREAIDAVSHQVSSSVSDVQVSAVDARKSETKDAITQLGGKLRCQNIDLPLQEDKKLQDGAYARLKGGVGMIGGVVEQGIQSVCDIFNGNESLETDLKVGGPSEDE